MATTKGTKAKQPKSSPSFFARAQRFFFYLALLYPVVIAILALPPVQRHAAFQHSIRIPLFAKFDVPEKYSLAPGKTFNTYIPTPDNETLGAWFILSDPYYQSLTTNAPSSYAAPTEDTVRDAIKAYPTVLYLHGAAGNRATSWRVKLYHSLTSRLHANVFVVDYRGFGDSTGTPDTAGLALDAHTAWQWLRAHGAAPGDVAVVGHSLGTGITGQLVRRLTAEGERPRGVALLAPFSSLSKLIETYPILGVPILQPLQTFPLGIKLLKWLIQHEFDTLSAMQDFHVPTLIAHAQDDMEIPHAHAHTLIDRLLEPLLPAPTVQLPSAPGAHLSTEEFLAFQKEQEERSAKRGAIVKTTQIPNFGMVEEFKGLQAPVVYVETFWGSHSHVGSQEGVQDQMARLFRLGPHANEESIVERLVEKLAS